MINGNIFTKILLKQKIEKKPKKFIGRVRKYADALTVCVQKMFWVVQITYMQVQNKKIDQQLNDRKINTNIIRRKKNLRKLRP